jgi:hypothetical protein
MSAGVAVLLGCVLLLATGAPQASAASPTAWTGSGPGTISVGNDGTTGLAQFTYHIQPSCCGSGTWTFSTVANTTGPVDLNWTDAGFYAFFQVRASLHAFVTHNGNTTSTTVLDVGPANCCDGPPSGGFTYTGTTKLTVAAGDTYGFTISGSNGDSNGTIQGTLTVGVVQDVAISTTATGSVELGGTIADSATLSGANGGHGTITFNAYADSSCTTAPLHTHAVPVNGDGVYSDPGFVPTTVGSYYWTASYSGDTTTATPAASESCGGANETSTVTDAGNDSWTHALPIALDGSGNGGAVGQIGISGQARWYKVDVTPGGDLSVDLTNLPANYDLAVFSDIGQAFNQLTSPTDLQTVSAEFGSDAFSPSVFSPSVFSPSVFSPSVFSPSVFSPSVFSPSVFSPSVFSPSVFSPSVFSPSVFSPSVFSPSVFSPSVFSPDPAIYEGAQTRSLIGISANDGTAAEHVFADIWNNTGSFYIRVNGRNGTYDPGAQFNLNVHENTGTCTGVTTSSDPLLASGYAVASPSVQTVILADYGRMPQGADIATMESKVSAFAARVNGAVVDVGQASPRVATLNAQADAHTGCAYAKNLVAGAIRDVVSAYRAQNPGLKYVVIVGNDGVIPFFRYPDTAGLGPEENYVPPVLDTSASQASLQSNDVLSQDAYGSANVLHVKGIDLPIPDLPVGRLVETPAEISGLLDAYMGLSNGVVPTPTSSLVTGYDFMAAGAKSVEGDLSAGLGSGAVDDQLISDQGVAPSDTGAPPLHSWTAQQLRTQLLSRRHDIIFLAGHFSANNALAADYSTTLDSTELASSSVNLKNSIVFSQGCHSGYNIVNGDAVPNVTQPLDWTEAFAQKGATLIAGTGYQYGDTDFVQYSELLYADFAHALRLGSGAVAVGSALVQAKQTYLTGTPSLQGIDVKSLLESTLYGLPMLGVDMPSGRIAPDGSTSIVGSTTQFATDPGLQLGLSFADLTLSPTLTTHTRQFVDENGSAAGQPLATYLSGSDGVDTSPGAPTLPLATSDVSVGGGKVLRGVGFRSGTYTDESGITPLTGAPATELTGVHSPFVSSAFFPSRIWTVNYFGGLVGDPAGTELMLTPAQYVSDAPGSLTDVQRTYSSVGLRLYYSGNTTTYGANTPALAAPPTISRVDAGTDGASVTFGVHVVGDPSAGIQQAWVTYTGVHPNTWESLDLSQSSEDSTLWTGTLSGLTSAQVSALRFIVQAVNGVGLVSLDDNQGSYYEADQIPPALQDSAAAARTVTSIQLDSPPASGDYGSSVSVSATLTAGGSPVAGEPVSFALGGSTAKAVTDGSGVASVQMPLVDLPGSYGLTAAFDGDATSIGSSAGSPFAIAKLGTSLALNGSRTAAVGADTGVIAALTSGAIGLTQRTVAFVLTPAGGGATVVQTRITDLFGRASLGSVPQLPGGTYDVRAYFGSGSPVALPSDSVYGDSASDTTQLAITIRQTIDFTSTPPAKALFGDGYTIAATGGGSGQPVVFSIDSTSDAGACALSGSRVSFTGAGSCVIDADQAGAGLYAAAPQVKQRLTVTYTRIVRGAVNGKLIVGADDAVLLAAGAVVNGPVTVQPGGALDVEGGAITGPFSSADAAAVRVCKATITGPVTVAGTHGAVVFGDDDGEASCPGSKITGPVKVTGNKGGVEFDGNKVTGPLTITGNTGPVHVAGNAVSGPSTIQH